MAKRTHPTEQSVKAGQTLYQVYGTGEPDRHNGFVYRINPIRVGSDKTPLPAPGCIAHELPAWFIKLNLSKRSRWVNRQINLSLYYSLKKARSAIERGLFR